MGWQSTNMEPGAKVNATAICHVVAMPYPGRGHINPMMNLCKLLASRTDNILITFVVTEEWLSFIGSDAKPHNIRFASIPNVIPSELVRGAVLHEFVEAVMTKMEAPFKQLLDQLEQPVTNIIADNSLFWAVRAGTCRNIPVALLCTFSTTFFSTLYCLNCIQEQKLVDLLEPGDKILDIPAGISSTQVSDLQTIFSGRSERIRQVFLNFLSWVPKAQYLLFNSVYVLEAKAYNAFKAELSFPIYSIGPAIPYFECEDSSSATISPHGTNYQEWLNFQPKGSVLYVSLGSFLSTSNDQMEEITAGLQISGVRYLLVARGETSRLKESCGEMGFAVPWCDQLKVLCHPSVGGFWTHCGWNSTLEGLFSGISMLTFPLMFDQIFNGRQIVEDWKTGWSVRGRGRDKNLVTRDEIAEIVQKFMDQESTEVQDMRKRAREFAEIFHSAVAKGGSSDQSIDAFIKDIAK